MKPSSTLKDFSSNDYLGFSNNGEINSIAVALLNENHLLGKNGASGSRLLTGNHQLFSSAETYIKEFHNAESALIFNSGYDANIGVFANVPQRGDIILFDELSHASIREGIRLGHARAFKFKHNDPDDLEKLLGKYARGESKEVGNGDVFIVTESVFSMDGDIAPLKDMVGLAEKYSAFLIIDEAHATGVFGQKGEGLVQAMNLEKKIFARIITFGKALGGHGAAVLGSEVLRKYLINFSRSFIYTTALPPHSVATILASYRVLYNNGVPHRDLLALKTSISLFKTELESHEISSKFIESDSAIHCCVIPGNNEVKKVATHLQEKGFDVRPILSPTVPPGKERLRICLHSFNTVKDIKALVEQLVIFIK
ncbi:MAG TPA: 8-amino-7-oxononanoate synthase [Gillisia sp.]|nr:8-amino-7-oxononanoate synthase [Gillisia sp.]